MHACNKETEIRSGCISAGSLHDKHLDFSPWQLQTGKLVVSLNLGKLFIPTSENCELCLFSVFTYSAMFLVSIITQVTIRKNYLNLFNVVRRSR